MGGSDTFVSLPTGYGKSLINALLPLVFNNIQGKLSSSYCVFSISLSVTTCHPLVHFLLPHTPPCPFLSIITYQPFPSIRGFFRKYGWLVSVSVSLLTT